MCSISVTTDSLADVVDGAADPGPEAARASLYYLLSRAFSSPQEIREDDAENLVRLIPELPVSVHDSAKRFSDEWNRALTDVESLTLAYAQHFLGPFEILSPPYASMYLEPDQKLMGAVSRNVANEYAEAGLVPGSRPNEVPDHVALEWEFMYFLAYQYATTGDNLWLTRRNRFMEVHMKPWLPKLAELMVEAQKHSYYNALADFMTCVVDDY